MLKLIRLTIRHESGLFAQRSNFFLLSQTIFLAAYSQFLEGLCPMKIIFISLGILTAAVWLVVATRNIILIHRLKKMLGKIIKKKDKTQLPKAGWELLSSNHLIGVLLPVSFLVTWIVIWIVEH
jgi:hypothetical protein